jgi:hypothetical protein
VKAQKNYVPDTVSSPHWKAQQLPKNSSENESKYKIISGNNKSNLKHHKPGNADYNSVHNFLSCDLLCNIVITDPPVPSWT